MTDLRDYQAAAVEQIERAIKALYVLPTGGGKTVIATGIIERAVAARRAGADANASAGNPKADFAQDLDRSWTDPSRIKCRSG